MYIIILTMYNLDLSWVNLFIFQASNAGEDGLIEE